MAASASSASAGLFIYACSLAPLARFYEAVLGLQRQDGPAGLVTLSGPGLTLLLHAIPPHIAADIVITVPPEPRESAALKFFFTVPSLDAARVTAAELGGEVSTTVWSGPDGQVCNAIDPEGNLFQLRQP